jgi:hypothetical protein
MPKIMNYAAIPKELYDRVINAGLSCDDGWYTHSFEKPYTKMAVAFGLGGYCRYIEFQYGFELINNKWQFIALYVYIIGFTGIKQYVRKSFDDAQFEKIFRQENRIYKPREIWKFLRRWSFEGARIISIFDIY